MKAISPVEVDFALLRIVKKPKNGIAADRRKHGLQSRSGKINKILHLPLLNNLRACDSEDARSLSHMGGHRLAIEAQLTKSRLQYLEKYGAEFNADQWNPLDYFSLDQSIGDSQPAAYVADQLEAYPNRSIIGPCDYSDEGLLLHIEANAPLALSNATTLAGHALVPPTLAPLLLQGATWGNIDNAIQRVLKLLGVEPTPEASRLACHDIFCVMGIGTNPERYSYFPQLHDWPTERFSPRPDEGWHPHGMRLSEALDNAESQFQPLKRLPLAGPRNMRKSWLREQPVDQDLFARIITSGGFETELKPAIHRHRNKILHHAQYLLSAENHSMGQFSRDELLSMNEWQYREGKRVLDTDFNEAMQMVFCGDWRDLDLQGPGQLKHDTKVLLARLIIACLSNTAARRSQRFLHMQAPELLAFSLLTGMPLVMLMEFALADCARRGETFMSYEVAEQLQDVIAVACGNSEAVSSGYVSWEKLTECRNRLHMQAKDPSAIPSQTWARQLRLGKKLLQSYTTRNVWLRVKYNEEGDSFTYRVAPDYRLEGLR